MHLFFHRFHLIVCIILHVSGLLFVVIFRLEFYCCDHSVSDVSCCWRVLVINSIFVYFQSRWSLCDHFAETFCSLLCCLCFVCSAWSVFFFSLFVSLITTIRFLSFTVEVYGAATLLPLLDVRGIADCGTSALAWRFPRSDPSSSIRISTAFTPPTRRSGFSAWKHRKLIGTGGRHRRRVSWGSIRWAKINLCSPSGCRSSCALCRRSDQM